MQGLGGKGPQLARQGEATSGAIMGELWGPWQEFLAHHELGNLQRTQSVSGQGACREGQEGGTAKQTGGTDDREGQENLVAQDQRTES